MCKRLGEDFRAGHQEPISVTLLGALQRLAELLNRVANCPRTGIGGLEPSNGLVAWKHAAIPLVHSVPLGIPPTDAPCYTFPPPHAKLGAVLWRWRYIPPPFRPQGVRYLAETHFNEENRRPHCPPVARLDKPIDGELSQHRTRKNEVSRFGENVTLPLQPKVEP